MDLRDVEDLITRQVLEDSTLEYKGQLDLSTGSEKREFLKDVTAMANAVGGTIIYGGVEGKGDHRGLLIELKAQRLHRDEVHQQIMNLLRDALDERLDGVLFKALETSVEGEYIFVLRIPASPLAPHRLKSGGDQFFLRGSVSNSPMNTRQIREMVLLRETAVDRALNLIETRTARLRDAGAVRHDDLHFGSSPFSNADQAVLHIIPLFPDRNGWGLGPDRQRRLLSVPALGYPEPFSEPFYSIEGMYSRFPARRHVLFLRGGGVEFQRYDVLLTGSETESSRLDAWQVEEDVILALTHCEHLTADGLLPLPVLVSLRLLGVGGSGIRKNPGRDGYYSRELQAEPDIFLTPFVVNSWGEFAFGQLRQMFDEMWQAWHLPQSTNFHPDGMHHQYDRDGYLLPVPDSEP